MGGTWMSVVYGFGGMKIRDGELSFNPRLPEKWKGLSFKILYRGRTLKVNIEKSKVTVENLEGEDMDLLLSNDRVLLKSGDTVFADL
jgi:trehalose/maltose hydrolase-like predicted phosphorylase